MRRITAGAFPGFHAPRRGRWSRLSVLWLAATLFLLRAWLPTGFMPDPDALRAGRFQLVYCGAGGPIPGATPMAGHRHGVAGMHTSTARDRAAGINAFHVRHMAADMHASGARPMAAAHQANLGDAAYAADHAPAPNDSGMPADCPFGLTGAYTFLPPLPAVIATMLALAWHMPAPSQTARALPGIAAGPPVGSRAPPYNLA